ncbi:MAG: response regulator [Oligoflexales bacterium]|nr:response regulator [Oligoflexales bacterium]
MAERKFNKVLVIDDARTMRLLLRDIISQMNYEVIEASNGREGIEMLRRHSDIAITFCDVNMPELDGLSMLYKLAKEKVLGEDIVLPPIIMITTENSEKLANIAKECGAKGWIIKPIKDGEIVCSMVRVIARK